MGVSLGDSSQVGRRRPVHGVYIKSGEPAIVFLTVCTKDRTPWLLEPGVHESLADIWQKAGAWLVGYYLLMPDHIHLFCAPQDTQHTLTAWVRFWKTNFTRAGLAQGRDWQRDYWDTRLRRSENYTEKWKYIQQNSVRKGLAKTPEDWPQQGHLNHLQW